MARAAAAEPSFRQASDRQRAGNRADVEREQERQRRPGHLLEQRRIPERDRVHMNRNAPIMIDVWIVVGQDLAREQAAERHRIAFVRAHCRWRWRSSHTGLSLTPFMMNSTISAGSTADPQHRSASRNQASDSRAGSRIDRPATTGESPSSSRSASFLKPCRASFAGQCSSVSGMPAAHTPPMPMPNSARHANSMP